MSVLVGECQVNGEPAVAGEPRKIRNGEGGREGLGEGLRGRGRRAGGMFPVFSHITSLHIPAFTRDKR